MAEMLKMSRAQYCHMEKERNMLSFNVLNGLYVHDWDVDYIITGKHTSYRHSLLEQLILECAKERRRKIYFLLLTAFLEMWSWEEDNLFEKCLQSEMKAVIMLLLEEAAFKEKLYYIRRVNGISQQELANILGTGRTKSAKCEKGEGQLDAELMIILYKKGYALPSFYLEEYAGISEIAYLLEQQPEMKKRYYKYVSGLLEYVMEDDKSLRLLQKSGVV